jgi:hypothetical protein
MFSTFQICCFSSVSFATSSFFPIAKHWSGQDSALKPPLFSTYNPEALNIIYALEKFYF